MEKNEAQQKLEHQRRQFPGLSMPDSTDRAMKLLMPETEDTKIAKEAMSEVSQRKSSNKSPGAYRLGGHLLGVPRRY